MKLGVYCIRDTRSTFLTPTVDTNDQTAMRNFANALMQSGSVLNTHTEDFALYKIGEYDQEKGQLIPISPIEFICDGGSIV